MNGIPLHLIDGDVFLPGGFRCSGGQLLHFFAAAVDGNALIPNHGHDIAAMPANQKFLFHIRSLP
jgi:hypothetical protein